MTLTEIKAAVAAVMNKSVSDFTVDGNDLFLFAVNQVRREAELLHDFEFSRKLVDLTVDGVTGGSLDDVTISGTRASSLLVSGTLSPNLAGTYKRGGFLINGYPFFLLIGATADASGILYYDGVAYYRIAQFIYFGLDDSYFRISGTNPVGTYAAEGTGITGTPVVTMVQDWTLKSIIDIGVYDDYDNLRPCEWTTVAEGLERQRLENYRANPRYPTDGELRSQPRGVGRFELSGNTLFHFRKDSTTDFDIGLEIYTFQNDWTAIAGTDDIWTKYGHKYLMWGTVVLLNHRFKTFVFRQEGNLPPPEKLRDEALAAFVEWDAAKFETNRRHGR